MSRFAPLLGAALGLALAAGPAAAERSIDVALLQPAVDSYGLVAAERAETPQRWEANAQLLLGYANRPLHLRMSNAAGNGAEDRDLVRGQLTADLALSLGLWDFLEVAALLPVGAQLYGDGLGETTAVTPPSMGAATPPTGATGIYRGAPRQNVDLASAGPRDPRLSIKARLWRGPHFGVALLLSATVPLGNSSSFLGDRFATLRPTLVADVRLLGRLSVLGNVGAVLRQGSALRDPVKPDVVLLESGHELSFALGLAYRAHRLVAASIELFGAAPLVGASPSAALPGDSSPPPALTPNADLLGAVHVYPRPGLRLVAGVGGGLVGSSPRRDDVRAIVGLAFSPAPRGEGLP